ncbi:MAG: hypothetical protein GX225_03800 [Clostridiales bacterium]|nr:hypothetical protein [Clostridiales bacterium]
MKKKIGIIAGVSAGVVTLGAVGATAFLLTRNAGELADISDREAIERGFDYMLSSEESQLSELFNYLTDKNIQLSGTSSMSVASDEEDFVGLPENGMDFNLTYGATFDRDNSKGLVSFDLDIPTYPSADMSVYYDEDVLMFSSKELFNDIYYIDLENFVEDFNNSIFSDLNGEITATQMEALISSSATYDFSAIEDGMRERLEKDITALLDNTITSRSDDSESFPYGSAYAIEGKVQTSDLVDIAYNQIQYVITNEDFISYMEDSYGSLFQLNDMEDITGSSTNIRTLLSQASLGMSLYYQKITNQVIDVIGSDVTFTMYLTKDVKVASFSTDINITDDESTLPLSFAIDFEGEDEPKDSINARFFAKHPENNEVLFKLSYKLITDGDTITNTVKFNADSTDIFKYVFTDNTKDHTFDIKLSLLDDNALSKSISEDDTYTSKFTSNGSYEITDTSYKLNVDNASLMLVGKKVLEFKLSFDIREFTGEIEVPTGKKINFLSLDESELEHLFEKYSR